MSRDFRGKVVIVTGSSMGIGKEVAKIFAAQHAKVVLNARNAERLNATRNELLESGFDVIAVTGDISSEKDCRMLIETTIQHYGKIDVVINNAGLSMRGRLEELSVDVITLMYGVNVVGPVILSRLAIPYLKENKGSLVFISSIAGLKGLPLISVYSSAKMALTAVADSIRIEHASENLHVGIVYVGYTEIQPGKQAIGSDGKGVFLDERKNIFVSGTIVVARKIVRNVRLRHNKTTIGMIGKTLGILFRFFPRTMEFVTLRSYRGLKNVYK
jgi:short-subunit dehydrogenase